MPTAVKLPYMIVPASNVVNKSLVPLTLVAVSVSIVDCFRHCIAPKEPESLSVPDNILEPAELNSRVLFRELAMMLYYFIG
jgi:hypothetical protein|tara:strand:+ start:815 stop:1057 length:243 start_codon:yes stop_codon:yes gene_type:complete